MLLNLNTIGPQEKPIYLFLIFDNIRPYKILSYLKVQIEVIIASLELFC